MSVGPCRADSSQPDKELHPRVVVDPVEKSRGKGSWEVIPGHAARGPHLSGAQ
ncbi:hypothetical protein GCM10027030_08520 [Luteococcus sediminum]